MGNALTAIGDLRAPTAARPHILAAALRWSSVLLLASLPFELYAGVGLAGLTFTNTELLALIVLGLWAATLAYERRIPRAPRGLAIGAAALLLAFVASALLAGPWRGAALKFSLRQVQGALLAACLVDQIVAGGWPLARRFALALIAGAAVSAALGLVELTERPAALALLAHFKEQPTLAGGLLRLSATFSYANIAAMYFEAVLPIALAGAALADRRRDQALIGAAAVALYAATLLTYSRAALFTANVVVALIALGAVLMRRRAPGAWRVAGLCAGLLVISLGLLALSPSFQTRIAEPDVDRWYRASYAAHPLPGIAPNATISATVTIRNEGLVTWTSAGLRPVALSYHWLDARSRLVVRYNGRRTAMPAPVAPGQAITLVAPVQAPLAPGKYILAWDMVVENGGWFSERGNPVAELPVMVAGAPVLSRPAPAPEPANRPQRIVALPPPIPRSQLWRGAILLWRAHPLLGIGPDVFRHVYGPALGLGQWDDRIHTNNLYLEILVGAGVVGLALFAALIVGAFAAAGRILRRAPAPLRWAALGCAAGLASFLLHGALDMFLEYTATYTLLWIWIAVCYGLGTMSRRSSGSAPASETTRASS